MSGEMGGGPATAPLAPDIPILAPTAEFAYEALVDIDLTLSLGRSPIGERRMVPILGGRFQGPRIRGSIMGGGADRQLIRDDGVRQLEAIYEMRADDGAIISVRNNVLIHDFPGEPRYAFSTLAITAPEGPHDWLNKGVFVGTLQKPNELPQVLIRVFRLC